MIFASVTSDTIWGLSMSLSNLNEVSNLRWRCQLSYETFFVWSVPKLECLETVIGYRDTLTPSLLKRPKSLHQLGLTKIFLYRLAGGFIPYKYKTYYKHFVYGDHCHKIKCGEFWSEKTPETYWTKQLFEVQYIQKSIIDCSAIWNN